MGKLERDVSASDEDDARRKTTELEELFTGDQMLRASNLHRRGLCARRYDNVSGFEHVVADHDRRRTRGRCTAVKRVDASFEKAGLTASRDLCDQRMLELHEPRPIDSGARRLNAFATQAANRLDGLGRTDE